MDRITLHGPAVDAAGLFCDAGVELRVADQIAEGDHEAPAPAAGTISSERAIELIDAGTAIDPDADPVEVAAITAALADAIEDGQLGSGDELVTGILDTSAALESQSVAVEGDSLDHDGDGRKGGSKPGARKH